MAQCWYLRLVRYCLTYKGCSGCEVLLALTKIGYQEVPCWGGLNLTS